MKKKVISFLTVLVLLFVVTSCIEEPEFRGVSNFKVDQISQEKLSFNMDVQVYNPNNKKIKIRKSKLKIYLNDIYIGDAQLLDRYRMNKRTVTLDNVPVEIYLQKDIFFSLMRIATGKTVKLRLEGNLKATVSGVPMRKKIDQTKDINLKELGINLGGFGLGDFKKYK